LEYWSVGPVPIVLSVWGVARYVGLLTRNRKPGRNEAEESKDMFCVALMASATFTVIHVALGCMFETRMSYPEIKSLYLLAVGSGAILLLVADSLLKWMTAYAPIADSSRRRRKRIPVWKQALAIPLIGLVHSIFWTMFSWVGGPIKYDETQFYWSALLLGSGKFALGFGWMICLGLGSVSGLLLLGTGRLTRDLWNFVYRGI
jgi:hypothetical protein